MVDGPEARIAKLEEIVLSGDPSMHNDDLWLEVKALSSELMKMKASNEKSPAGKSNDMEKIAVIGGLMSLGRLDDAWQWIANQLWWLHGSQPDEIYGKGEFQGIAYAKFGSKHDRDEAVNMLRQARLQNDGKEIWANYDQPLGQRICSSFLLGLRWQLNHWGYSKKDYYANIDCMNLEVNKKRVLSVEIEAGRFKLNWLGAPWESWHELLTAPEFKHLLDRDVNKVQQIDGKEHGK